MKYNKGFRDRVLMAVFVSLPSASYKVFEPR